MKFINPIFNTEEIRTFIFDMIYDYDYSSYAEVSFEEKCELGSLLIKACGRDDEHECLLQSNDLDQLMGAVRKALSGTLEDDKHLIAIMKENVVHYFDKTMQALFEDCHESFIDLHTHERQRA